MEVADRIGIAGNRAQNFHKDREGIALHYRVVSETISKFKPAGASLPDDWNEEIEADYERRGGKNDGRNERSDK